MSAYRIISTAGADHGVYEGATKREVFIAMLRETGSESEYGEPHVGTEADWIFEEVRPAIIQIEHGYLGFRFRISDEADERNGGWSSVYRSRREAISGAEDYLERCRPELDARKLVMEAL